MGVQPRSGARALSEWARQRVGVYHNPYLQSNPIGAQLSRALMLFSLPLAPYKSLSSFTEHLYDFMGEGSHSTRDGVAPLNGHIPQGRQILGRSRMVTMAS